MGFSLRRWLRQRRTQPGDLGILGTASDRLRCLRPGLATALLTGLLVLALPSVAAARFERLPGFNAPGTPSKYDRVGILEIGPKRAPNILVLNPGTSASAAYFTPLARDVVRKAKGWQVWAVERRENLLEDHSVLDRAKRGAATPQEVCNYYLGWITDPGITNHFQLI